MNEKKELKAQRDFATGCRVYQNGLNAVNQGQWPSMRENASLDDVLKETQQPRLPQKEIDR